MYLNAALFLGHVLIASHGKFFLSSISWKVSLSQLNDNSWGTRSFARYLFINIVILNSIKTLLRIFNIILHITYEGKNIVEWQKFSFLGHSYKEIPFWHLQKYLKCIHLTKCSRVENFLSCDQDFPWFQISKIFFERILI